MKTEIKKEIELEPADNKPEYDGYEDIIEPTIEGKYVTVRRKVYLSDKEVKAFLGEHDPAKYFRLGRVPISMPKSIGTLLPEDREEVIIKNEVFAKFPEVLMFKHNLTNIYTLLIPKVIADFEVTDGEFTNRLVQSDTRSIPFNGGAGRPSSWSVDYFKKVSMGDGKSSGILTILEKKFEERKKNLS
jgi:hypothetical protein